MDSIQAAYTKYDRIDLLMRRLFDTALAGRECPYVSFNGYVNDFNVPSSKVTNPNHYSSYSATVFDGTGAIMVQFPKDAFGENFEDVFAKAINSSQKIEVGGIIKRGTGPLGVILGMYVSSAK